MQKQNINLWISPVFNEKNLWISPFIPLKTMTICTLQKHSIKGFLWQLLFIVHRAILLIAENTTPFTLKEHFMLLPFLDVIIWLSTPRAMPWAG